MGEETRPAIVEDEFLDDEGEEEVQSVPVATPEIVQPVAIATLPAEVARKPKVFLAAPSYGSITPEHTAAILQAGKDTHFIYSARSASLLAMNFNALWCQALNSRHLGLDYFCMLHSDIYPLKIGWLDTLVQIIRDFHVDIVSVISPLKDDRGLTSCGVLNKEGRIQRLTLKEAFKLPPTWTTDDTKDKEVVPVMNTGLWIADFTKDWVEKVHFNIRDGIKKGEDGQFRAEVLSEDWHFSQMCANLGVKIALTREIPIKHIGRGEYTNTSPWGTLETDTFSDPER